MFTHQPPKLVESPFPFRWVPVGLELNGERTQAVSKGTWTQGQRPWPESSVELAERA